MQNFIYIYRDKNKTLTNELETDLTTVNEYKESITDGSSHKFIRKCSQNHNIQNSTSPIRVNKISSKKRTS